MSPDRQATIPDVLVVKFRPGPDSRPFRTAVARLRLNPPTPGMPYPVWHGRALAVTPIGMETVLEVGLIAFNDRCEVCVKVHPAAPWLSADVKPVGDPGRPAFTTGPFDFFGSGDLVRVEVQPAGGQ